MKYVLIIALIFFIGCQQEAPVEVGSEISDQEATLYKPPANSGPYVVRAEYPLLGNWILYSDTKTNLTAVFGVDLFKACSGLGLEYDILPVIDIYVPEDLNRIIEIQKGQVHTYVFEGMYPGGGVCAWLAENPALAWGMSDIVLTDNDIFVFENPDNKNANAFGFTLHGQLTTPNGETAVFSGMSRSVWDGVDGSKFFHQVSKIRLN
jgi:hypothetical protein